MDHSYLYNKIEINHISIKTKNKEILFYQYDITSEKAETINSPNKKYGEQYEEFIFEVKLNETLDNGETVSIRFDDPNSRVFKYEGRMYLSGDVWQFKKHMLGFGKRYAKIIIRNESGKSIISSLPIWFIIKEALQKDAPVEKTIKILDSLDSNQLQNLSIGVANGNNDYDEYCFPCQVVPFDIKNQAPLTLNQYGPVVHKNPDFLTQSENEKYETLEISLEELVCPEMIKEYSENLTVNYKTKSIVGKWIYIIQPKKIIAEVYAIDKDTFHIVYYPNIQLDPKRRFEPADVFSKGKIFLDSKDTHFFFLSPIQLSKQSVELLLDKYEIVAVKKSFSENTSFEEIPEIYVMNTKPKAPASTDSIPTNITKRFYNKIPGHFKDITYSSNYGKAGYLLDQQIKFETKRVPQPEYYVLQEAEFEAWYNEVRRQIQTDSMQVKLIDPFEWTVSLHSQYLNQLAENESKSTKEQYASKLFVAETLKSWKDNGVDIDGCLKDGEPENTINSINASIKTDNELMESKMHNLSKYALSDAHYIVELSAMTMGWDEFYFLILHYCIITTDIIRSKNGILYATKLCGETKRFPASCIFYLDAKESPLFNGEYESQIIKKRDDLTTYFEQGKNSISLINSIFFELYPTAKEVKKLKGVFMELSFIAENIGISTKKLNATEIINQIKNQQKITNDFYNRGTSTKYDSKTSSKTSTHPMKNQLMELSDKHKKMIEELKEAKDLDIVKKNKHINLKDLSLDDWERLSVENEIKIGKIEKKSDKSVNDYHEKSKLLKKQRQIKLHILERTKGGSHSKLVELTKRISIMGDSKSYAALNSSYLKDGIDRYEKFLKEPIKNNPIKFRVDASIHVMNIGIIIAQMVYEKDADKQKDLYYKFGAAFSDAAIFYINTIKLQVSKTGSKSSTAFTASFYKRFGISVFAVVGIYTTSHLFSKDFGKFLVKAKTSSDSFEILAAGMITVSSGLAITSFTTHLIVSSFSLFPAGGPIFVSAVLLVSVVLQIGAFIISFWTDNLYQKFAKRCFLGIYGDSNESEEFKVGNYDYIGLFSPKLEAKILLEFLSAFQVKKVNKVFDRHLNYIYDKNESRTSRAYYDGSRFGYIQILLPSTLNYRLSKIEIKILKAKNSSQRWEFKFMEYKKFSIEEISTKTIYKLSDNDYPSSYLWKYGNSLIIGDDKYLGRDNSSYYQYYLHVKIDLFGDEQTILPRKGTSVEIDINKLKEDTIVNSLNQEYWQPKPN